MSSNDEILTTDVCPSTETVDISMPRVARVEDVADGWIDVHALNVSPLTPGFTFTGRFTKVERGTPMPYPDPLADDESERD